LLETPALHGVFGMNKMPYLFAAYMAIWILLAFYLFFIHSKEKKLQEEVRRLKRMLEKYQQS
jgi:CcmD family protein